MKQNNEAVSPVIGVILLVAITVILCAAVFVIVSKLSQNTEVPVFIGISEDDNEYIITSAPDEELTYSDLVISGCSTVNRGNDTLTSEDVVMAGDRFVDCESPLTISYDGKLIYQGD